MIVAGFGLRASASLASLQALLGAHRPDLLAIVEDKADHPALTALATAQGIPLRLVPIAALCPGQTPAPHQPARYGATSLAEATALAAAGPNAALILPRIIAPDGCATMALAKGTPK